MDFYWKQRNNNHNVSNGKYCIISMKFSEKNKQYFPILDHKYSVLFRAWPNYAVPQPCLISRYFYRKGDTNYTVSNFKLEVTNFRQCVITC